MRAAQKELHFQNVIIDSYKLAGGHGKKWASDRQVGVPDLILSLPIYGGHLAEVKHRPKWKLGATYDNPLEPIQVKNCRDFISGGMMVMGIVIIEKSDVLGSYACTFDPLVAQIKTDPEFAIPYVAGSKFDANEIAKQGREWHAIRLTSDRLKRMAADKMKEGLGK